MSPLEKATVEKLKRAESRRVKRLANISVVYAYRNKRTGHITDNFISLPKSEESAHRSFLERQIASALLNGNYGTNIDDFEIIRLGDFDKSKIDFIRRSVEVIFALKDVHDKVKEINHV